MSVATLMLMYAGILYGVPRRTAEVVRNIPDRVQPLGCDSDIRVFGIFALLAILSGVLFVVVSVGSLLFGDRLAPRRRRRHASRRRAPRRRRRSDPRGRARGTFTLCLIFLGVFVAVYV